MIRCNTVDAKMNPIPIDIQYKTWSDKNSWISLLN